MCGAVSAGRLVNVPPVVTTVTMTGTSPAPASEAGSVTLIWSKPGVFEGLTVTGLSAAAVPTMSVVPMRTVMPLAVATPRTPVSTMSNCVATVSVSAEVQSPPPDPTGRVVVTAKGSPGGATQGFVTLSTAARPPGPFVEVKMSGCAGFRTSEVRMTAPLLNIVTGKAVVPAASPRGTTKFICPDETKYRPAAAPATETVTPFNSTGSGGRRRVSLASAMLT